MPLTPLEIHSKEFHRSFRGYDEDEVNEFLNQIIKDYENFIQQKKKADAKIEELQQRLDKFVGIKDSLNKSISVAQGAAENLKRNAKSEAGLIVKEAEKNADRIVNEALEKSRKLSIEVEEMKNQAALYKSKLRLLVESQLKMLFGDDVEDPDPIWDVPAITMTSDADIVSDTISQMDQVLSDSFDDDQDTDTLKSFNSYEDYFDLPSLKTDDIKSAELDYDEPIKKAYNGFDESKMEELSSLVASMQARNEEEQAPQKRRMRFRTRKNL